MNDDGPMSEDPVVCRACGRTLIPLSYEVWPEDDPRGFERPLLKCPGCGEHYGWAEWAD